jgi:hypothetical protein
MHNVSMALSRYHCCNKKATLHFAGNNETYLYLHAKYPTFLSSFNLVQISGQIFKKKVPNTYINAIRPTQTTMIQAARRAEEKTKVQRDRRT